MKKQASKKGGKKGKKAGKKAAKKAAKKGGAPAQDAAQGPRVEGLNVPAWGEPLVVGRIGDAPVEVPVPLNEAALEEMTPVAGVALVLHHRVKELEENVKLLQRDLDLHHRLARLEAALGEGPGASADED